MAQNKNKELSINEFINIADIKGETLYTKDGYIFSYIKIYPMSIDLMTYNEKKRLTTIITAELSAINQPFKLLFISRPTDIKHLINYYEGIKISTSDPIKRDNLSKTINYISGLAMGGGILERQTFLVCYKKEGEEKELKQLTYEFLQGLIKGKYRAYVCDQIEVTQMCNLFLNPNISDVDILSTSPTYPFFAKEKQDEEK